MFGVIGCYELPLVDVELNEKGDSSGEILSIFCSTF